MSCILLPLTPGYLDISLIYMKEKLDFSQTLFGYYSGLENAMNGLTLLVALPLVKKFTSVRNLPLTLAGLASFMATYTVFGIASTKGMVFLGG